MHPPPCRRVEKIGTAAAARPTALLCRLKGLLEVAGHEGRMCPLVSTTVKEDLKDTGDVRATYPRVPTVTDDNLQTGYP